MKKILTFFAFYLALSTIASGQDSYTANGSYTWTCPAGVTSVTVQCWGAGGAGGGVNKNGNNAGGGGAGGAYAGSTLSVTPGTSYTISVGQGGAGTTGNGNSGGDSWFNSTGTIIAKGGAGGKGNSGSGGSGSTSGCKGTTIYQGGGGLAGNGSFASGGGGGAGSTGNGGSASSSSPYSGGAGASVGGGNGGDGTTSHNVAGQNGQGAGGGGGGANVTGNSDLAGGNGADGRVDIAWNCIAYSLTGTTVSNAPCAGGSATIILTGSAASLPVGTYTVTYSLSAPNSSSINTATMVVNTAGTGTFTTGALANAGATTVKVYGLSSGSSDNFPLFLCASVISSNNTAIINVSSALSALTYSNAGPVSYCTGNAVTNPVSTITGGGTITYSVSPSLPAGLSINSSTGAISGAPTSTSNAKNYTITASNGCSSTTVVINITVVTGLSGLSYNNPGPLKYCTGSSISSNSASVTGSGTITYSVSPALPAGLSLNSSTGSITGTPTAATAAANYTVTASNGCSSTTTVLNISINSPLSGLTYSVASPTYCTGNSITNAVNSITGTGTTTYSVSPSLPAGLSINSSTGAISGTPTATSNAKNYTITASNGCSSTTATVNITVIMGLSGLSYTTPGPVGYCTGSAIAPNTVSAITGSGTITYSVSPALPAGLSINSSTGAISGTPTTVAAAANYTITASNGCSSATTTINISTGTPLSGLSYSIPGPVTYCSGNAISSNNVSSITGSGTITYSVSPALPSGLSLNASSGAISGTPFSASAAANYTVTATNGCSSTTRTINITVITGLSGLSYNNAGPLTYCAGTVIATNSVSYITGGGTITYSVSPSLPGGLSINSATGAISGTPTSAAAATNYTVTATNSCSSTASILNIAVVTGLSGLSYSNVGPVTYCTGGAITANVVSGVTGGGTITYSVSPALPAGLSIGSATGSITGTPTAVTSAANYTVTASNGCSSTTAILNITIGSPLSGLTYTTPGPVTYCSGNAIIANTVSSITGAGTITYSVSPSLAAGLSINSSTGAITGTPASASAAANYTVTATNGCSSTTKTINITVITGLSGLNYNNPGPVTYCTGVSITPNTVSAITGGGTITYSVSPALPGGLSLNSATGSISGTATLPAAAANYTITASNGCSSTSKTLNITVTAGLAGLTYTSSGPATYCAGTAITPNTVASITGAGTITYSVSPTLPAGLSISSATGAITGTPTAAAVAANYTVTASNGCSSTTAVLNITVVTGASGLSYASPGPLTYCMGNTITPNTVAAISGGGTITYSVSPALPVGLSINAATGAISGTPTAATAAANYTVTATNGCSTTMVVLNITIPATPGTVTVSGGGASCGSATLTASGGPGGTIYFQGTTSNGTSTGTPSSSQSITTSGTYYFRSYNGSCWGAQGSATVIINPSPTISGTLTVCAGSTSQLTGSGTPAAVGPWTSASGSVAKVSSTGLATGVAGGTSVITYTDVNGCTTNATVTVNGRPTASLSGNQTICSTGSATLPISVTGSGTISGTLSDGTSFSGSAPAIVVSVTPSATTTYTISTLTNGTCTSIASDMTGSTKVTVTQAPSGSISYPGSPFCSGTGVGNVTYSGLSGGIFVGSSSGVDIDPGTGTIDLPSSDPGVYTISYTVPAGHGCAAYTASTVVAIQPNVWIGAISTDWNTAGNWAGQALPIPGCPTITVPSNAPYQPIINSGVATLNNLLVKSNASMLLAGATLQIAGTITNSGILDAGNGTIEMNGSSAQTIPAGAFLNNALKNLIISNSSGTGVSLGGPLDVYGSVTFTGSGKTLATNDYLTFKSNAAGTAWLGNMTGNTITGKATVERYLSAQKAWRFLSVPTNTTQTIQQTWQEGATSSSSNPVGGFGIQITGGGGPAAGFDLYSAAPSMKTYDPTTNGWVGVPSTNTTNIKATQGYMVFVRGDRSVATVSAAPTSTVVRTKGNLYVGDQPAITVLPSKFAAIGNPYPSAIDMRNITKTGVKDFFYAWDPKLAGGSGYGGYQTFSNNGSGSYVITPGGGSYGSTGSINNYIQSGQAFFVQGTSSGGSLNFKEGAKTTGSSLVSTPATQPLPLLRVTLYDVNTDKSSYISDGFLVNYGDDYSNAVDDMDAIKSSNSSENLSIKRGSNLLVVERRHSITSQDTIFFNLTTVSVRNYRFEIDAEQLYQPGLTGYLLDSYLNTRTSLNIDGMTLVDFNIANIPGSYAANRFSIVFSQPLAVLPVTFTSVKAYNQDSNILVTWEVENQSNMKQYEVQKSADGNNFSTLDITPATSSTSFSYGFVDQHSYSGNNYYRIKSVDVNGNVAYSEVVKVRTGGTVNRNITIFPNPVIKGTINLRFINQPAGIYNVSIINQLGQSILEKAINHISGNDTEVLQLDGKSEHGIYQVRVTCPDNEVKTIRIIY